jgi:hypothetical protein
MMVTGPWGLADFPKPLETGAAPFGAAPVCPMTPEGR